MINERMIMAMAAFDEGDPERIQHFVKVYGYAHMIGIMENIPSEKQRILDITAIMHDIAIVPCEKKLGKYDGKTQEIYGPDYAREVLKDFPEIQKEEVERICFLIAHHHTYEGIDDIDYQILLEADYLVNAHEHGLKKEAIITFRDKIFKTQTGINLLNHMFAL